MTAPVAAVVLQLRARSTRRGTWAVYCQDGNLWEPQLTEDEANLEVLVAARECDCGGEHEARRMPKADSPEQPA